MAASREQHERVLVLAPVGHDAIRASEALCQAGIITRVCADVDEMIRAWSTETCPLLLVQAALLPEIAERLLKLLTTAPDRLDLALIAFVDGAESGMAARSAALLDQPVDVVFLEQPVQAATLVSVVRTLLRTRRRQAELHERLTAQIQAGEAERQARLVAERAVRIRDEFLASVVHDLKNPLGVILGLVQLLQRQIAGMPEAVKYVQGLAKIEAIVVKTIAQVDELLDLAYLQTDQALHLNLRPTDLVALARRVAVIYQHMSARHRIRVETDLTELFGIWDASRLERVLSNLLANAIKYSPAGGEIVIRISQESGDEPLAMLSVQDHGIGIPAADLPHILERFYRARNAVGRLPGTGLGLAGARQIVEQHGGTMTVTSREGEGSTFTICLPLVRTTLRRYDARS